MTDPENVKEVLALKPDYLGFIFYPGSKRFLDPLQASWVKEVPGVKKAGVFVNAGLEEILEITSALSLDAVQLHGSESPEICKELKSANFEVIKAIGLNEAFSWRSLEVYQDSVDNFLFDTASAQFGGTGKSFNWELLQKYPLQIPYFLSGGLDPENLFAAYSVDDHRLFALDLNSRFEERPGIKNISVLKKALSLII
ncbi:phosphoribosylanthranilate isomerase [bacterium A37T11]|nr:phosphoribosylanthranilate isomerase [bacterium A37T11]